MDPVDKLQQRDINRLLEMARDNRRTDAWQWAALTAVTLVIVGYLVFVFGALAKSQADTIKILSGKVK